MVIAHIPDVHSLADWRTDSRIVKADGDTSTVPKCGIMLLKGWPAGWDQTQEGCGGKCTLPPSPRST
jgi:hypothetical protein